MIKSPHKVQKQYTSELASGRGNPDIEYQERYTIGA